MLVHEFGNHDNPVLLLFPGTSCYWKGTFGGVIDQLSEDFLVGAVSYTGFDENDAGDFESVLADVERVEAYVQEHYQGRICAAYGSSLGGSFVAQLAARSNIHMAYGIIGSSDLDQAGPTKASLEAALMGKLIYPYIHTGQYTSKLMRKRYDQQMADPDPYNRAFVAMVGRDRYDLSFISKQSIVNQFKSDLVTPLPLHIDNGETEIHVFYAKKMGEKYLQRYREHFAHPVIHEQDMRHEEFLALHPQEWCALVKDICLEGKGNFAAGPDGSTAGQSSDATGWDSDISGQDGNALVQ